RVGELIEWLGFRANRMLAAQRTAIGITGNKSAVEQGTLGEMSGVQEVIAVSKPYKLVSRDVKEEGTVIRFPACDGSFGGRDLGIIGGPCSVGSREQAVILAGRVAPSGARFFRGGAYKPRPRPCASQ